MRTTDLHRLDRQFSKETLQEFVAKKREMFLVQYALGIKKDEMKNRVEYLKEEIMRANNDCEDIHGEYGHI